MNLFKGLAKITTSPLRGVKEIVDDVKGDNGDAYGGLSILTLGASSLIKGTAKGLSDGVDDIFEE